MRLNNSRQSRNVEDRRSSGPRIGRGGSIGIGTVVLALVAMYFGVDPSVVLNMADQGAPGAPASTSVPADDVQGQFVVRVLGETEQTWGEIFQAQTNGQYQEPVLVLFRGATPTACGTGQSAMGPFYCPADQKVYIDLSFFDEMQNRLNAPGDFARAYVIAHEVGHHVQNITGQFDRVAELRKRHPDQANALSVRTELQADCYAGVWAHHADARRNILEEGDLQQAVNAAAAVGDDRLAQQSQGRITPDAFTHGTSAQRMTWLKKGLSSGRLADCNTFSASAL